MGLLALDGVTLAPRDAAAGGTGWTVPFAGSRSAPVVQDGVIFVGAHDGALHALDFATGRTRWKHQTGVGLGSDHVIHVEASSDEVASTLALLHHLKHGTPALRVIDARPVVDRGSVFVASRDRSLHAVDAATGLPRWKLDLPGESSGLALAGDRVLLSTANRVDAVDRADGKLVWSVEAYPGAPKDSRDSPSLPVVEGGTAFVSASPPRFCDDYRDPGSGEGCAGASPRRPAAIAVLLALDAATGAVRWRAETPALGCHAPVVADGLACFTVTPLEDEAPVLRGLDAATGAIRWTFGSKAATGHAEGQPLVAGGRVMLATRHGLHALDAATGTPVWRQDGDHWLASIRHEDGIVLAIRAGGRPWTLQGLDAASGASRWSTAVDTQSFIMATGEGVVHVAGQSSLTTFAVGTGKRRWTVKTRGYVSSAPVLADGMACFATATESTGSMPERGRFTCVDARTGER